MPEKHIIKVQYEEGPERYLAKDENGWHTTGRDKALEFATAQESSDALKEAQAAISKATLTVQTLVEDEFGRFLVKTELTVLSADPPAKPLGFIMHERDGVEIHLYEEGREYKRDENGRFGLEPITEESAIEPGTKVIVHGMMGELFLMTVRRDKYGVLYAKGEKLTGILEYGKDDRHAWVCLGLVNMAGVKKLELHTDGG